MSRKKQARGVMQELRGKEISPERLSASRLTPNASRL
jgi:hypothetical protein